MYKGVGFPLDCCNGRGFRTSSLNFLWSSMVGFSPTFINSTMVCKPWLEWSMNVLLDMEGSARLPKVVVILYLVSSNNTKSYIFN